MRPRSDVYSKALLQQQLLAGRVAQWRDRALDAEAKINDLYNQLDEMAAHIEQLKLKIEEYEHTDRENEETTYRRGREWL